MLTQKETVEVIKPHYHELLTILSKARDRLALVDRERHALRKTTIANFYRDLAVDEARLTFGDRQAEGISLIDEKDGSFFIEFTGFALGIDGAAWVRIKKVDNNYLTSNIATKKSVNFNSQISIGYIMQPFLDGVDWNVNAKILQPTHINIGHQWDELGTDIQEVVLTCPENNHTIAWIEKLGDSNTMAIEIYNSDSETNIVDFPIRLEVTNQKPKRISAKKNNTDKEKVKKDGTSS